MFQSLRYIGAEEDWSGYSYYSYEIIDDAFRESFRVQTRARAQMVREIVEIYKNRHLNVAKNLSLFYISLNATIMLMSASRIQQEISVDTQYIDIMYPSMDYGKLYPNCIKRHIKCFLWTRSIFK